MRDSTGGRTQRLELVGDYAGEWIDWYVDSVRLDDLRRDETYIGKDGIPTVAFLDYLRHTVIASSITEFDGEEIDLRSIEAWLKLPARFTFDVLRAFDQQRGRM